MTTPPLVQQWMRSVSESAATELTQLRAPSEQWSDWQWQQRNSIKTLADLSARLGGLDEASLERISGNLKDRKLSLTPYVMSLIELDPQTGKPVADDPVWKQLVPDWSAGPASSIDYNGATDNWEMKHEMKTPICQHKYPNRVILRVANICHSYCQFCYEALRTLESSSEKDSMSDRHWQDTLAYITNSPGVEEVILSGGEPLMLADRKLDAMLQSLRAIERPLALRIHTRALTFNPFRITDALVSIIRQHDVQAIGLHVSSTAEVTAEFAAAVRRLRVAAPILFANIPLLHGINDSVEQMHELCMRLYLVGVVPHYLYHFMPFSPGGNAYRTAVRKGIDIIRGLKRSVSNIAVPEFVLPHHTGKFSPPLLGEHEPAPEWTENAASAPVVKYVNWQGQLVEYADAGGVSA